MMNHPTGITYTKLIEILARETREQQADPHRKSGVSLSENLALTCFLVHATSLVRVLRDETQSQDIYERCVSIVGRE